MAETVSSHRQICPFMSHQVIVPVDGGHLARPNGVAVSPLVVPCLQGQCACAYTGDDGEFVGCGLAIGQDTDRLQAHLSRMADRAMPAVGSSDALAAVAALQRSIEKLLQIFINKVETKTKEGHRESVSHSV